MLSNETIVALAPGWYGSLLGVTIGGALIPAEGIDRPEPHQGWSIDNPIAHGVGKRLQAGLASLAGRADLVVDVRADGAHDGRPVRCSPYGDTDRTWPIDVGDIDGPRPFGGRRARVVGTLVLHTTVGRRFEWSFGGDTFLWVWPSEGGDPTVCTLPRAFPLQVGDILHRVTGVLAARLLLDLLMTTPGRRPW